MKREKRRSRGADGFKQIRRESTREQGGKQGRLRKAGKAAVSRELGSKEEKGDRAIGRKGKAEVWECREAKMRGGKQGSRMGVTQREDQERTGTIAPGGRKGSRNPERPSKGKATGGGGATAGPPGRGAEGATPAGTAAWSAVAA